MSEPSWSVEDFLYLIQAVVDTSSITVIDGSGSLLLNAGDEVDLGPVASGLWDLPYGEVLDRHAWTARGLDLGANDGDWLVVDQFGDGPQIIVVLGLGEVPTGGTAKALAMVLGGARERRNLIHEVADKESLLRLADASAVLAHITRAQRDFILEGDAREVFGRLLDGILSLTDSEYGFIGEVEPGDDGEPMLRTWAITNIAWTEELEQWFEQNSATGIEFTNLDTLFGAVIRTGEPVIANVPSTDPRRGGLPDGHPPMDAFVGLPFVRGDELLGMVGLANRPGGYDKAVIAELEPFLTTCSTIIQALRGNRERDKTAASLYASEARGDAILESIGDAVIAVDGSGRIDTFNRAAERTFEHTLDDVLGCHASMLFSEGINASGLERYANNTASGPSNTRHEIRGRRRDGSSFPLELTVNQVDTIDGELFVLTARDLTDKHQADRDIEMYARTIEATSDFVSVAEADGKVLAINRAGRELVGLPLDMPTEELAVGDIHAPWSRQLVVEVGLPTAIQEGAWIGETAFMSPEGEEIPMSQVIVVSKDKGGEVQMVSTIARDITELKEIERVKGEFVSTVSHELRTPLTSIRGSLGLLSGGALGELAAQPAEMIEVALSNTERLIRLVNDILDFEKAQARRLEIQVERVDPPAVVRDAMRSLEGLSGELGVPIEFECHEEPTLEVFGDADRLVQVLVNLIGNALKFSPEGEAVAVSLLPNTDSVHFEVADRGPGIPADQLESIFEPFHQVDSSDGRQVGGTGLGLAIAKAIAEAHGGEVSVSSTVGRGSTFTLAIPATQVELAPTERPAPRSRVDVLIAEDDNSTRLVIRRLLEEQGLSCDEAVSGDDVEQIVRAASPRLLLMDVAMRAQDGFTVTEHLQQTALSDLPLVIYTDRDLTSAERDRLHLGESRHLVKSLATERQLVDTVCELLGRQSPESSN